MEFIVLYWQQGEGWPLQIDEAEQQGSAVSPFGAGLRQACTY